MTDLLAAMIAREEVLRAACPGTPLVVLEQGFAMLPFDVGDPLDERFGRSLWLDAEREAIVRATSGSGPVAYVEANLWGGEGVLSAVVWHDGATIMEARHTRTPPGEWDDYEVTPTLAIDHSRGLARRVPRNAWDGFEAIGLDRHRLPRDWIAEAR